MTSGPSAQSPRLAGFRLKLLVAMMLVVSAVTVLALYIAERRLAADVEADIEREFAAQLQALERTRDVRRAMLVERCRSLVKRPRIRAAFEDDALDLLYEAARYELQDVMTAEGLHAMFYRFLDPKGAAISLRPGAGHPVGALTPEEERQLGLPRLPDAPQGGYLVRNGALSEIVALPILSSESAAPIAALALGFKPVELERGAASGMQAGIWLGERLHGLSLPAGVEAQLPAVVARATREPEQIELAGVSHLMLAKRLNPDSHYPPAFDVCFFPLGDLLTRQRTLRWQVIGAGVALLLLGLAGSQLVAERFSAPVEKLALDSERSARFSADASHQLKTPVTVLRAGLEELLRNEKLTPEECVQVSALIHQTYRLSSLIEDLLLLSRMDSGRLKLNLGPVNLSRLIEGSLDDLSALPDHLELEVEVAFPPDLHILGEKRYTAIILQNLLENAHKYNRKGGFIRLTARIEGGIVRVFVTNSGRPIAAATQEHIFERFHRAGVAENIPGYGLGLNLARELARLHQGDLRLVRSDATSTEFEVCFPLATVVAEEVRA